MANLHVSGIPFEKIYVLLLEMTVHRQTLNQKSPSYIVTMCWLSLWGNDNEIKLCFSRTYCSPQTLVWEPVDYIKDMKNSSNYISVQPPRNKNNNKYLLFALSCEWLPSVHVAYNKCNIKIDVQNFMSWNEKPPPFHASWKKAFSTEVTVNKSPGHFGPGPLGQTLHNRLYELHAVSCWRLL